MLVRRVFRSCRVTLAALTLPIAGQAGILLTFGEGDLSVSVYAEDYELLDIDSDSAASSETIGGGGLGRILSRIASTELSGSGATATFLVTVDPSEIAASGQGDAYAYSGKDSEANGSGESILKLQFELTRPAEFGFALFADTKGSSFAYLSMIGPAGFIVEAFSGAGGGLLAPGLYTVLLEASGSASSASGSLDDASATGEFTFQVRVLPTPEPAPGVLVLGAAALAIAVRRYARSSRSASQRIVRP
jgi:hypothetical protein